MTRINALVGFLAVLAASATAGAQGMITSGSAVLDFTRLDDTGGYSTDLTTTDGTDHFFGLGVWYRVGATDGESRLGTPTTDTYVANVATFTYTDVDSTGLDMVVTATLTEPAAGQAAVAFTVNVMNTTSAAIALELFAYADFEAGGTASGDSATLMSALPNPVIQVTDGSAAVTFSGTAVDTFQVIDFSTLRGLLNDFMPTTLDGTGLPFVDDDWTGAYGWSETIAAGGSATVSYGATAAEALGDGGVIGTDGGTDGGPTTGTDGGTDGGMTGADGGMTGADGGMAGADGGMVDSDGGMTGMDGGPMAGTDGGPTTGTDAGGAVGTDAGSTAPPVEDGGCSCRVQSSSSDARGGLAALIILGALWLRRRR